MPTREQKLVSYAAWRVTVPGSGAKQQKKLEDLRRSCEGLTLRGGRTVVDVDKMDGELDCAQVESSAKIRFSKKSPAGTHHGRV